MKAKKHNVNTKRPVECSACITLAKTMKMPWQTNWLDVMYTQFDKIETIHKAKTKGKSKGKSNG